MSETSFEEGSTDEIQCCVCSQDIVEDSVRLDCSHAVCYLCWDQNNNIDSESCPVCQEFSKENTLINCPNEGCDKDSFNVIELVSHLRKDCGYEITKCEHIGCVFTAKRKEMASHENDPEYAQTHLQLMQSYFKQTVTRLNNIQRQLSDTECQLERTQKRLDTERKITPQLFRGVSLVSLSEIQRSQTPPTRTTRVNREAEARSLFRSFRETMKLAF